MAMPSWETAVLAPLRNIRTGAAIRLPNRNEAPRVKFKTAIGINGNVTAMITTPTLVTPIFLLSDASETQITNVDNQTTTPAGKSKIEKNKRASGRTPRSAR
jgi:hypothetical protein